MKNFEEKSERNHYIDLLRGLCILGIILNHTCFYSGDSYVPKEFANLVLLLDVPALFLISGMTYQLIKRDMILNSIVKFSLCFTVISLVLNFMYRELSWKSLLQPLFLGGVQVPEFFVCVQNSYWFVPVYVIVLVAGETLLQKLRPLYPVFLFFCIAAYFYDYFIGFSLMEVKIFGWDASYVLFYLGMFLFGYFVQDKVVISQKRKIWALSILCTSVLIYSALYLKFKGVNAVALELASKFPPKLPYVVLSFISAACFIFFYKAERSCKFLEHIGKNAIFYYACQGMGASILYLVAPKVVLPMFFKLVLMFGINLLLVVIFAEVLKFVFDLVGDVYRRW